MRLRRRAPAIQVGPGERLLAWASTDSGLAGGTRDAVYLPGDAGVVRVPWEQVEAAGWNSETEILQVTEVGTWGAPRPEYRLRVTDPGRLPELVRERVSATVVFQRHVPIHGSRGVRVIARRAPGGDRSVTWLYEYDEGVDPVDPEVARAAREVLDGARLDLGVD